MSKVVQFDGPTLRRVPPRTVTQKEILHERILHARAKRAAQRWRRHRKDIRDRLIAGAKVEEGPFAVGLDIKIR